MKFKLNERGFVLAEFAVALPLLILLLYALGIVTLNALKIAREQAADYTLETEAQYVIDRITSDARVTQSVQIKKVKDFDEIIFYCHGLGGLYKDNLKIDGAEKSLEYIQDILDPRIYRVDNRNGAFFHVYFKRRDDDNKNDHTSPLTGDSTFGDHYITKFEVDREKLEHKILHLTLEMESYVTEQKVKFTTSVFMPACEVPSNE